MSKKKTKQTQAEHAIELDHAVEVEQGDPPQVTVALGEPSVLVGRLNPTLFRVFMDEGTGTLEAKRVMRAACDVVEATWGILCRSKHNPRAGSRLNADGGIEPIAGYNVIAICGTPATAAAARQKFWRPGVLVQEGQHDVVKVDARTRTVCVPSPTVGALAVVAGLGLGEPVTPSKWAAAEAAKAALEEGKLVAASARAEARHALAEARVLAADAKKKAKQAKASPPVKTETDPA